MEKRRRATARKMRGFTCAYCKGKGRDPFGLLSPLSACQVCGGKGRVVMAVTEEQITPCHYCHGSGRHPLSRMTCTVCSGKGVLPVNEKAPQCPSCQGTGSAPGKGMPCSACGGRGVVKELSRRAGVTLRQR